MLTMMRNMLRSKFAGLLFLLLIVAMGAWGITDVFSGSLGNNLAVAGDSELSEAQLDQEVDRELRSATDERGRSLSKAQAVERGMVDQIYQRELFRTALVAYADRLGARATDAAVLDVIRTDPSFATDTGTFDPDRFRRLLSDNGFTPAMFEAFLKRDLTISRLTETTQAGLQPPPALTSLQAAYSGELRTASWFVLPRSAVPPVEPVTDEELVAFYDEQKQALTHPQRRRISLINLKVDDFLNQSEFTEDELRAYYDAVKDREFAGPDTRSWTEFVFNDEAAARAALGRIAGGAAPATLPGLANSAERNGRQTSMSNQDLAQRVFGPAAAPGSIFGPVPTGNFYTVARLESITPGDVEPFDTVREDILDALSREQAIGLYYDSLNRLDNLIGTGAPLEEIGKEMGTPVLSFSPVDQTGVTEQGLAPTALRQDPDILTRAFELTEGGTTARFGVDEVAYILRVDSVIDAYTPPLDEIREDLRTVLNRQREAEALTEEAQSIESEIESGEVTFEAAAARYGAGIESPESGFTRRPGENSAVPTAFVAGVYTLRNEGDIYLAPTQNRDEIAVVQLTGIDRPSPAELRALSPVSEPQMRAQLANDLMDAFLSDIQRTVDLEVNQQAFQAYKARVNPDT